MLEAAGAVLAWDVLAGDPVPAARVHDPALAAEWLWEVYGSATEDILAGTPDVTVPRTVTGRSGTPAGPSPSWTGHRRGGQHRPVPGCRRWIPLCFKRNALSHCRMWSICSTTRTPSCVPSGRSCSRRRRTWPAGSPRSPRTTGSTGPRAGADPGRVRARGGRWAWRRRDHRAHRDVRCGLDARAGRGRWMPPHRPSGRSSGVRARRSSRCRSCRGQAKAPGGTVRRGRRDAGRGRRVGPRHRVGARAGLGAVAAAGSACGRRVRARLRRARRTRAGGRHAARRGHRLRAVPRRSPSATLTERIAR